MNPSPHAVRCPPAHRESALRGAVESLTEIEKRCASLAIALEHELGMRHTAKAVAAAGATIRIAIQRLEGAS